MRQAPVQHRLGHVRNGLEQRHGHLGAHHGRRLQEPLVLRWQSVDASRQDGLYRGRYLNSQQRLRQAVHAWVAHQHLGLHEGADALLQEEGVALGARNQERLEGHETRIIPQQRLQEFVGVRRGERIKAELRIVGLTAPAVLVLRPVIDQQLELGRGQALDEAVEQGLGLGIDPVQILEHQQQRLHLTFAQQHALERLERALAALRRIEAAKRTVLRQDLQEGEQRRNRVLEGLIQGQHLAGHFGPDSAHFILVLHMAVAPQEIEHREIGGRLAI